MKHPIRSALIAFGFTALLAGSGVAWYALSPPPVEKLALDPNLIAISSPEGKQLLANSQSKTDFYELAPYLVGQTRRAFCGPATSAAVVNAALHPQPLVTQTSVFNGAASEVKGELALSLSGLTLDQLAAFLRAQGLRVQEVHADRSDLANFRGVARTTLGEPRTYLVVNYDRRVLKQEGVGHISPVGAYDAETDRLLVLDVAKQKYPFTWVPATLLWAAMDTTDSDSGNKRGYLLVSSQ